MNGEQISAEKLKTIIDKGLDKDTVLIDVRTEAEFSRGAIAGAINIPVDHILDRVDELKQYKTIYLYCLSGGRSGVTQSDLISAGLKDKILNLTGGLLAWRKHKYPVL